MFIAFTSFFTFGPFFWDTADLIIVFSIAVIMAVTLFLFIKGYFFQWISLMTFPITKIIFKITEIYIAEKFLGISLTTDYSTYIAIIALLVVNSLPIGKQFNKFCSKRISSSIRSRYKIKND